MRAALRFSIEEASGVGEARRAGVDLARALEFGDVKQGEVAIVVTELATNLVKHAGGGEMLIQPVAAPGAVGLDVLALDRGPGFARPGEVLRDGYSTAGTPGTGLGAVRRIAGVFDTYSGPNVGTAVHARVLVSPGPSGVFDVGALVVAYPGERVSGDDVGVALLSDRLCALVVDGLGHGLGAHDAARAAATAFAHTSAAAPPDVLAAMHHALRGTRGAVAGVACIRPASGSVTFGGVGNITATVLTPTGRRGFASHNGTLGQTPPRGDAFTLPWTPESLLVLHSDGLTSNWSIERLPGLARRSAALIAGVMYRDFRRGRDDVSVLVVKERAP